MCQIIFMQCDTLLLDSAKTQKQNPDCLKVRCITFIQQVKSWV